MHVVCCITDNGFYKMAEITATAQIPVEVAASADIVGAIQKQTDLAGRQYEQLAKQINKLSSLEGKEMADIMTPTVPMMIGAGGTDGLFGGSGGGLVGGLILGSLLRNNGNLFGNGNVEGAALGATLRNPPEQNQANMDLMAGIGAVDKAVAVGTAAMEASQAAQSASIVSQLNSITGSLATRVEGVKDVVNANSVALMQGQNAIQQNVMENRYELSKDISSDGEKTRALITQQYEATLNRQLGEANAALIELRTQAAIAERTRGVEVNTTNNINQMQQQQQQQAQYGQLANLIWALGQQIRSTNEAINVGSGVLTANPANTNTNIR